jgi:hypothetical protein
MAGRFGPLTLCCPISLLCISREHYTEQHKA